jgi:DNA-binding MarR family transcriptional regulator
MSNGPALDVVAALVRSSSLIMDLCTAASRAHDLTLQQAQLLCVAGDRRPTMSEACTLLRIEKSSMSGLMARAESAGLVVRVRDEQDGRTVRIELTEAGRQRATAYRGQATAMVETVIAGFGPAERSSLASMLSGLLETHNAPDRWHLESPAAAT